MKGKSKSSATSARVQLLRTSTGTSIDARQYSASAGIRQPMCRCLVYERRSTMELILERESDEHGHADVVVIEEGAKTSITVAVADQPKLINKEHRRADQSCVIPGAGAQDFPHQVQRH